MDPNQEPPQPQPTPPSPEAVPAEKSFLPLPENWPGAFGAYKFSKQAVKLNVNAIVGWPILIGIVSIILEAVLKLPGRILSYVFEALSASIMTVAYISAVRQQRLSFGEAFSKGLHYWLKVFLLGFLVFISVVVSLLLLVIPVFFVWPRLALTNYFLVDKDMGVLEAYRASWQATKGHVGKLYGIVGANIAMALLFITIIGIPFSIYFLIMYSAATALLYEMILKQPVQAAAEPAGEPVAPPSPATPEAPLVS